MQVQQDGQSRDDTNADCRHDRVEDDYVRSMWGQKVGQRTEQAAGVQAVRAVNQPRLHPINIHAQRGSALTMARALQ